MARAAAARRRLRVPRGVVPVRHALPGRLLLGAGGGSRPAAARRARRRLRRRVGARPRAGGDRARGPARAHRPRPLVGGAAAATSPATSGSGTRWPARGRWRAAPAACCATPRSARRAGLRLGARAGARARRSPLAPAVTAPAPAQRGGRGLLPLRRRARAAQGAGGARARAFRARPRARARRPSWSSRGTAGSRARQRAGDRRLGHVGDDLGPPSTRARWRVVSPRGRGLRAPARRGARPRDAGDRSDLPVLREVLGDGALYVPPGDAAALADALLSWPTTRPCASGSRPPGARRSRPELGRTARRDARGAGGGRPA